MSPTKPEAISFSSKTHKIIVGSETGDISTLDIDSPERKARFYAFSYLLQKKVNVSLRNQVSASEATSSTL